LVHLLTLQLTLARNILLYTLLIDEPETHPKHLWSLYFDLYITAKTHEVIHKQSSKLAQFSSSMQIWNDSPYAKCFRMINKDTLATLKHIWEQYAPGSPDLLSSHKAATKKLYDTYHRDLNSLGLTRSAGPQAMSLELSAKSADGGDKAWQRSSGRYWLRGTVDIEDTVRPYYNPLFAYSGASGSTLAIRKDTNPLLGFHLITGLAQLTSDSPYSPESRTTGVLKSSISAAKLEFRTWCDSFRRRVRSTAQSIRLRFMVADATSFCIALCHLKDPTLGVIANRYARPGSLKTLELNGPDYVIDSLSPAPTSFEVVDTNYLADSSGFLNFVPYILPLFSSVSSVLYTNTIIEQGEENMLYSMLCTTDISTMCTFIGLVPTGYLTGMTTRSYLHDNPTADSTRPVITCITWRSTTSADPLLDSSLTAPFCSPKPLASFLCDVFVNMVAARIWSEDVRIYRAPNYNMGGFASFLRFLMNRIHANWSDVMRFLLVTIQRKPGVSFMWEELLVYLHLYGVQEYPVASALHLMPTPHLQVHPGESTRLSNAVTMIVSIPKRSVNIIRDKVIKYGEHMCIRFYVDITWHNSNMYRHTFMSTHPIFGTLTPLSSENLNATIQEDPNGWRGTSDLHVCFYFPGPMMLGPPPEYGFLTVRMSKETETMACFTSSFGPDLEILKTRLGTRLTQVSDFLPGLQRPETMYTSCLDSTTPPGDATATNSLRMEVGDGNFTKRLQIHDAKEHSSLKDGAKVTIAQSSACTVTVTYDAFEHICHFPFPVAGNSARVRLSRKEGWMEVIAPLLTPGKRSQYHAPYFPLTRLPDSTISTWNLPYVNFERLPKLDNSAKNVGWMTTHLLSMFSDRERPERTTKKDFSTNLKNVIHALLWPDNIAVRLLPVPGAGSPILIIKSGVYLELTSHSIVCDAYYITEDVLGTNTCAEITLSKTDMNFWRSALPAMAERCRTWKHTTSCKYDDKNMCQCGKGKIAQDFADRTEWKGFQPHATRVAISPLFALPYLEPTRGIYKHARSRDFSTLMGHKGPITDDFDINAEKSNCAKCGKKGGKKCGKCQQVYYCSKECQAQDWKSHKAFCKLPV
jgi:hypothetical protein